MKLTYDQLLSCTTGAFITRENADGSIYLRRMTDRQKNIYAADDPHRNTGSRATNITFDFYTDSETMTLHFSGNMPGSRASVLVDVLVDGLTHASQQQWTEKVDCGPKDPRPYGPVTFFFQLPKGEKRVTVMFNYNVTVDSAALELSDGASFRPYVHKYTWIAFGDSITQGYSANHPAFTYISRLSRLLDAKVHNYGIGGERFEAEKIQGEYPECDFVTVAYGTNDYGHKAGSNEIFEANMPIFMEKAAKQFANVPIFILLPLWRLNHDEPHNDVGPLSHVRDRIVEEAAKYPNMTVIDCWDAVEPVLKNFADARLHPNNTGMKQYAEFVYEAIKDKI